jgi:hypothetical protein
MFKTFFLLAAVAGLAALTAPSEADAYGAAHVGYTHVGPNGVQHYGATAASGPRGAYEGSHTSAYGAAGGAYHAGSATAAGGYRYAPSTAGGAAHYGYAYVR